MSFDVDVAIVGCGPAGASTALHLVRREGLRPERILVLDKARFPREKPCAGAISTPGVDALRELGVGLEVPFVSLRGVRVLDDDEVGETACAAGVIVRRREFDASLLRTVRNDGVDVREGCALSGIARVDGGFRLATATGAVRTRLVAACDGASGITKKLFGVREPARRGHLYVTETRLGPHDDAMIRGYVDFDLSVRHDGLEGYYWDFPAIIDGRRYVSRGIYHANLARRPAPVKEAFARALERRGVAIDDVTLKPFSVRPFVRGTATFLHRVVFVGEAAGIDRTTGEGIAQAIVMGQLAARRLAESLLRGASLAPYARDVVESTVGRHMLQSAWLASRVYGRFGGIARRFLLRSEMARSAAMRWYVGERLGRREKLRLAAGLAWPTR